MAETVQVQTLLAMASLAVHDLVFYIGQSGLALGQVPYYLARYTLGRALYTGMVAAGVAALLKLRSQYEAE